ncbi:membrane protein insertase YidC, partial [Nocardioides sp.]|uniref:membrane protein insertase YidC n=1 Tax=Nocardioides sp. TaxID=35761 RepID=UPI002B264B65
TLGYSPDALKAADDTVFLKYILRRVPLFVKQIKSQRNMQLIQPRVKELQKKYGHDRQKLGEETMKLYKDAGTNPFASCLPLLLQMPIFFALFRLLDQAAKNQTPHGFLTKDLATKFGEAKIGGAVPIYESFWGARTWGDTPDGGVMIVAFILVIAMTATTFLTQRQLMSKNMPADAMSGPYAQQQKMLLYVLPLVFGLGGIAFPIGVLLYWTTSNIWTMCQQFYVIRNNPAPGTPAFKAKQDRDRAKEREAGIASGEIIPEPEPETDRRPAVRQQPKRQSKAQRQANPHNSSRRPSPDAAAGEATPTSDPVASEDTTPDQPGTPGTSAGKPGTPHRSKKKRGGR